MVLFLKFDFVQSSFKIMFYSTYASFSTVSIIRVLLLPRFRFYKQTCYMCLLLFTTLLGAISYTSEPCEFYACIAFVTLLF